MPYLVDEAPVLPALTVQVAIQRDVCKGREEGRSLQGAQEPSTGRGLYSLDRSTCQEEGRQSVQWASVWFFSFVCLPV